MLSEMLIDSYPMKVACNLSAPSKVVEYNKIKEKSPK